MPDNTTLNPGVGGDTIATEDPGTGYKIPVSKIRIGSEDVDGGDVTITNPFPILLTDGTNGAVSVNNGNLSVEEASSTSSSQTSVSANNSSVVLLSPNAARKGATVYNDSIDTLYLILGATASTTSFTVIMEPTDYYETPFNYAGYIAGIWSGTNGFARITELQ